MEVEAVVYLIMASPHMLYAYVWTSPVLYQRFCSLCNRVLGKSWNAVEWFEWTAHVIKIVQTVTFITWYFTCGSLPALDQWVSFKSVFGIALLAFGQYLNVLVYKLLGRDGVYYGSRLGRPVAWVTGFPFNSIPHPQYVGASVTFVGLCTLLSTPSHVQNGLWWICTFICLCYGMSSLIEQHL